MRETGRRGLAAYFVRLFGFELLKDLLRLSFRGTHREEWSITMSDSLLEREERVR